jgi:hypothetical protein
MSWQYNKIERRLINRELGRSPAVSLWGRRAAHMGAERSTLPFDPP